MYSKIVLALLLVSFVATFGTVQSYALTQKDNEAKEEIDNGLSKIAPSNIKTLTAQTFDNKSIVVYNQSQAPPSPPPTCPPNTVYNETSKTCVPIPPQPPKCPAGQIWNTTTQQCQDTQTPPPPPPPPVNDKPNKTVNANDTFRMAAIADIDNNAGLITQLKLMNDYHVQFLIVMGDYGYNSCQGVIDKLKANGFTPANTVITQGNHDCDAITKAFNGWSQLYGHKVISDLEVFAIDANQKFDCSSAQYTALKDEIASSELKYKIAAVHQPFVTVKSTHGANGQFSCWDPLFRAEAVNPVLEGHNHNYQRFDVNGITYELVGTGTHDTGSSMYPLNSNSWNSFACQKCITGTNGFALMDLAIGDPNVKGIQGWFISNSDKVMDSFH